MVQLNCDGSQDADATDMHNFKRELKLKKIFKIYIHRRREKGFHFPPCM